jgi:hypothetical protein
VSFVVKLGVALIAAKAAIVLVNVAIRAYAAATKLAAGATIFLQSLAGPLAWVKLVAGVAAATLAIIAMESALSDTAEAAAETQKQVAKLPKTMPGIPGGLGGRGRPGVPGPDVNIEVPPGFIEARDKIKQLGNEVARLESGMSQAEWEIRQLGKTAGAERKQIEELLRLQRRVEDLRAREGEGPLERQAAIATEATLARERAMQGFPEAMEKGSREAYSRILAAGQRGAAARPMEAVQRNTEQMAADIREVKDGINVMVDRAQDPMDIPD